MASTHLLFGILLMPFMGLDCAQGPCPTPCRCTLEILNCSRITDSPGFHLIPLPKPGVHPHPFTYLDFTGNAILSIGKEVWDSYPWAEYLILRANSLSRVQTSSLEGLHSITYLDLSHNKIHIIERNAFEAVPFLEIINLSGNIIDQIAEGTFEAWHGMQFLLTVDLSHNPLTVIQDSSFYSLPSLNLLDLGATKVIPKTLENLLQTSLQLRMLILPRKMSCCLCSVKENIKVSFETIKLDCSKSCTIDRTMCGKEELSNSIQEVMKILEARKLNSSKMLSLLPERAEPHNYLLESAEPSSDMLAPAQNYSNIALKFNLLKSVKQVMKMKGDVPLDMNWADKKQLKTLYLLASLLEAALEEKITELPQETPEATVQKELPAQGLEESPDKASNKERLVKKIMRENWFRINQRSKATLFGHVRDKQEFSKATTPSADQPSIFESHNKVESQRKLMEGLDSQHALSFLRFRREALQSSWKRSVSDFLLNALNPTGSITKDKSNNHLSSISSDRGTVAVLDNGHRVRFMTEKELLDKLLRSSTPTGEDNPKASTVNSEPSLNELSPDILLSRGISWKHQRTSASPPQNLANQYHFYQRDVFEANLNKKLAPLITNTPVRRLISRVIRLLKMDCKTPTVQIACAKLVSRTGLLMKVFSQNVNTTSSLWKSYFWSSKNASNTTTASSRNLEKSLPPSHGIPEHGYINKMVLGVSVTATLVAVIIVICLIKICTEHSASNDSCFLGRFKKSIPDEERSDAASAPAPAPPP